MKETAKALALAVLGFAKKRPFVSCGILIVCAILGNVAMIEAEKHPHLACSPCHVMAPYVDNYEQGHYLGNVHQKAHVDCIDCHENTLVEKAQETWWYATDDFYDPPYKRDFGNEMCLKCHTDLERIVAKTVVGENLNPHDSHLGALNCADCHKMHMQSKAACIDCHEFPFMANLPPEWQRLGEKPEPQPGLEDEAAEAK